jgi:hypothetical protein
VQLEQQLVVVSLQMAVQLPRFSAATCPRNSFFGRSEIALKMFICCCSKFEIRVDLGNLHFRHAFGATTEVSPHLRHSLGVFLLVVIVNSSLRIIAEAITLLECLGHNRMLVVTCFRHSDTGIWQLITEQRQIWLPLHKLLPRFVQAESSLVGLGTFRVDLLE